MNCLKCGREVLSEQVFCEDCLAEMVKYPVDPGTPVQLPRREATTAKRTVKRRTVPLEEQVRRLRKRVRQLAIALLVVCALVLALAYPAIKHLTEEHFAPGQNYSVTGTAASESAPQ